MRWGILGGTFDPVHLGHLILAEHCREQARLDQVWFIPAARPPHKQERQLTLFDQRVEMLQLAVAGNPSFRVDSLEKDRPGPSYTADTLRELHQRYPGDEFFLIVGADCLPDLPSWYEPVRVAELAVLLIATRPGWSAWPLERLRSALALPADKPLRLQVVQIPLLGLSSSDIRQRVPEGRSIRYLVPRSVECYIEAHRLYNSPLTK
jgi:nicotinate-nucleotide adenylyltransferase